MLLVERHDHAREALLSANRAHLPHAHHNEVIGPREHIGR
jgi:hypothetical protein